MVYLKTGGCRSSVNVIKKVRELPGPTEKKKNDRSDGPVMSRLLLNRRSIRFPWGLNRRSI